MIMELLERNLEQIFTQEFNRRLSSMSIFLLAEQMVDRLEQIHECKIIH